MKSAASRRHLALPLGLMVLLACAFALEGAQPIHTHANGRLGLYNADCPLAQLAAMHGDVWTPPAPAIGSPPAIVLPPVLGPSTRALSPSARFTASRAPPLA